MNEATRESSSTPLVMQVLHQKFHDLMPKKLQDKLPPMQTIQHNIDLILDA